MELEQLLLVLKEINQLGYLVYNENWNNEFRFTIDLDTLGKIRKVLHELE